VSDDADATHPEELVAADMIEVIVRVEQRLHHARADPRCRGHDVHRAVRKAAVDHHDSVIADENADVASGA
jgi:hypothetical protein